MSSGSVIPWSFPFSLKFPSKARYKIYKNLQEIEVTDRKLKMRSDIRGPANSHPSDKFDLDEDKPDIQLPTLLERSQLHLPDLALGLHTSTS
jgi:hypothetical protein